MSNQQWGQLTLVLENSVSFSTVGLYLFAAIIHLPSHLQGADLRSAYYKYLKEASADLRKDNPTWTGAEVLAKAREMPGAYTPTAYQFH